MYLQLSTLQKSVSANKHFAKKSVSANKHFAKKCICTSIEDKILLFSLWNSTYKLTDSYRSDNTEICICTKKVDLAHIYECNSLNSDNLLIDYNNIFNGTLY